MNTPLKFLIVLCLFIVSCQRVSPVMKFKHKTFVYALQKYDMDGAYKIILEMEKDIKNNAEQQFIENMYTEYIEFIIHNEAQIKAHRESEFNKKYKKR